MVVGNVEMLKFPEVLFLMLMLMLNHPAIQPSSASALALASTITRSLAYLKFTPPSIHPASGGGYPLNPLNLL